MTSAGEWTQDDKGVSNNSDKFKALIAEVARLIRGDAHALLCGGSEGTARIIMAQLAHVHHLAPAPSPDLLRASENMLGMLLADSDPASLNLPEGVEAADFIPVYQAFSAAIAAARAALTATDTREGEVK